MNSKVEESIADSRRQYLQQKLTRFTEYARPPELPVQGHLVQMTGLTLVAQGCRAAVGSRCRIVISDRNVIEAEVVGFANGNLYLMPIGRVRGLNPGAKVIPISDYPEVGVGDSLLGRVIDGNGGALDGQGELQHEHHVSLLGPPINPFERMPIQQALDVGVRVINSLLSIGRGQRIGLFAGSGVGKSVLLGQMTKNTEAEIVVVGLIGERGREVREFVENTIGRENLSKAIVVATPADDPPLMRLHGAWRATAIAEYYRDQGKHVLLLIDSLTRFAQAQREIALAIGEPPVTKGYPPSVFAQIPQLVERAGTGCGSTSGSITALYTVLAEGDDQNDPIADATRSILDGHIVLSRQLADAGIYPAINIESSISRVMNSIIDTEHSASAIRFRKLYSTYEQNKDLINVGAYQAGSDRSIDEAIKYYPLLLEFIQQRESESCSYTHSLEQLHSVVRAEEH